MTRRLFLHVGMGKCASTTLQHFFLDARQALAAAGVSYPLTDHDRPDIVGNGALLGPAILGRNGLDWRTMLEGFLAGEGDVLVSSENLSGFINVTAMGAVGRWLRDRGIEPHVLMFVRRQDHWLGSSFAQQIKGEARRAMSLPDWIANREEHGLPDYAHGADRWMRHFRNGQVHIIPLRTDQPEAFPVDALLARLGVGDLGVPLRDGRVNTSPPAGLLEPARLLKDRLLRSDQPPGFVVRAVRAFFADAPDLVEVPRRRFLMPATAREALLDRYAASNARMAQWTDGAPGFETGVDPDPASDAPLAPEARQVLDAYLAHRPGLRDVIAALGGV